jgi:phosphoglycerate dehydrogenase-like enzyme
MADTLTVVLPPVLPQGVAKAFAEVAGAHGLTIESCDSDDVIVDALQAGAEIFVPFRFNDRFVVPHTRWVAAVTAGVEQLPLDLLANQQTIVTSAQGANAIPVAEHAMALVLACVRRLGESNRLAVACRWDLRPARIELCDSTLVILGLGTIGEEIARRAQAFGMHVIGIKRNPAVYEGCVTDVRSPDELREAAKEAQVLISVLPDSEQTRGLVDADVLDALGRGVFVNVGRGSVVEEDVLVAALTSGALHGAGLDVFHTEPLPETSPLWELENVVMSPHIGGSGPRYGERFIAQFLTNLAAFRGEGPWLNRVV